MKIRYTRRAVVRVRQAFVYTLRTWGHEQVDVLGVALDRSEKQISTFPHSGKTGRADGTRELSVPGTPFILIYRDRDTITEILTCIHESEQWPEL